MAELEEDLSQSLDNQPPGKGNGVYTYPGKKNAFYQKKDGNWYKKVGNSGYQKIQSGDVDQRVELLEENAIPFEIKTDIVPKLPQNIVEKNLDVNEVVKKAKNVALPPKIKIEKENDIFVWKEYDPESPDADDSMYKVITNPKRVNELNKKYKNNASTSPLEMIYTGFPNREDNEYRVNSDNLWERKEPGSNYFFTVSNPDAAKYLNKQFKQNANIFDDKKAKEIVGQNDYIRDFNARLTKINPDLIGKDTDDVLSELQFSFPEFKFERNGSSGLRVYNPKDKNETNISLDNWFGSDDKLNSERLKGFLKENLLSNTSESYNKWIQSQAELEGKISKAVLKEDNGIITKDIADATNVDRTILNEQVRRDLGAMSSVLFPKEVEKIKTTEKEFVNSYSDAIKSTYSRVKDKSEDEKNAAFAAIKTEDINDKIVYAVNRYGDEVKDKTNDFIKEQKAFNVYVQDINDKVKSGEISPEDYDANYKKYISNKVEELNLKSSDIQGELKNLNASQFGVNKSIAGNYLLNEKQGTFVGGVTRSIVQGVLDTPFYIAGLNKKEKKEFVDGIVGSGTTEEYMNSDDRWDITKAAFQMTRSLAAMASGAALGGPAGTVGRYATLYAMSYNEMKDDLDGKDISNEDKVLMSAAYGVVGSILENVGIGYLIGKSAAKIGATNWILKHAFSEIPKGASKEFIEAQIMSSTKLYVSKIALTQAGVQVVEGATEGSQALAQVGIQEVYDQMKGTEYFNNKSSWQILGDAGYEAYMGALGAGIVETVQQSGEVLRRGTNAFVNKDQMKLLIKSAKLEGIDQALLSNLKASILNGKISTAEAKEIVRSFKDIKGKVNSMPDDMSVDKKSVALDLMVERDNLNKKIEGKEPTLVVKEKARIEEINNQLKNVDNAVQEPSTEEILQRQPETTGEAGGKRGGVEQVVQGEEVAQEGGEQANVQEEVVPGATAKIADVDIVYPTEPQAEERKAFRSTSDYVENASKELPIEDVETLTKELDGEFGLLTADNPMAQPLTEEENKQLNQKAEEWLTGRGYKPRRITGKYGQAENSFFVPNLTRQDAIDFAKQFNQESVAHSDGLVYQDGSMNPRVKADDNLSFTESYSPDSDFVSVVNTKDGLKTFSIGYNFDQKVMPEQQAATQISEVTITPETSQTVTERINKETDTKRKKVFTAVQKVLSAIPNSRIILHDNTDSFVAGVAKSANKTKEDAKKDGADTFRGAYVNGDIHINLETAGVTTVFHEALHDLLAKKGIETNAILEMAKGLRSVISDKALKTRLDKFVSQYTEEIDQNKSKEEIEEAKKEEELTKAEEYMVELGAIMSEAQKELTTTKWQQFKTLINNIAKKLNLPIVFAKAATAQDAVDFMNSMAGKLGKGENILTDGFQTNIVSDKIKSQRPVKVNKDQKLTFVKQSDIIDIKSLIDDIVSKNQNVWFWVADQLGRGIYFDSVINGDHYLDAGPSYALDPENRSKGIIWASGAKPTTLTKNIDKSDYIFIVSGSPQLSKLFNKKVSGIVKSRVENKVNFNDFKNNILNSKPTKPILDILNKYNSYDELFNGADRKAFIIAINEQQNKNTPLKKLLESYDAFVDLNELRDGFYKDNDFKMGDVMLILKPEKVGDKSKHSTYETDIIGSVVGVPDMIINSYDLMTDEVRNKYKDNLARAQQQQVVAPYGIGVKKIAQIKAQKTEPVAGNKLFNEPLKDAETIAKSYMKSIGMEYVPVEKITKLDENLSKRIADAYDKMKNDPNDPDVKKAYEFLAKETLDQYDAIISKGYKVEINNDEPYSSSDDMISDLKDNKRMKIFSTESGFGDEPITEDQRKENVLLTDSGRKDANGETLLVNDVFRFVHDFFGHAKLGNSFGPIGEENAWRVHSVMYSPEAKKAMTSETRGQNSWVNFSGANDAVFKKRDKARQLRKEGKIEEANQMVGEVYEDMKFADQKVGLLPDFAVNDGSPSKIKAQKLAPNGKPSNLDDVQWEQVRTTAFKKWFGDWENDPQNASKIVDENGEPMPVYHGTTEDFEIFMGGSYFTDDYMNADGYASGEIVLETFLNIKNPLIIESKGRKWDNLKSKYGSSTQEITGKLDEKKYDGVVFNNINDNWFDDEEGEPQNVYYTLEPNQVKLADGTNTTFDAKNPSIKAQKQSKEDAIQSAKDVHEKSFKRFKDQNRAIANAVNNLEKSYWYLNADDAQREQAVREVKQSLGVKIKQAPSVNKIMGKTKQTAFVSDLGAAIRDQVRLEARSSRETAKNINDKRKALGDAIKSVVKQYKGKITERQLNSINKRIANVNLFNQEMVDRVVDYVNKVMNNAEYIKKINDAFSERRAIRRMIKSGNMAETVAVAKEFTIIDPSMVDDIDAYLEMASKIRGAVKTSKRVKDTVSLKEIVNFGEAYEYINPTLEAQEESMRNMMLAEYQDLVDSGIISKDMTLKDITKIINAVRNNVNEDEKIENEEKAKDFLKQKLEDIKYSLYLISKFGSHPLTGENIIMSDRVRSIINNIMKSDINNMSTKQMIQMVDSLNNYIENGAIGGIEAAFKIIEGQKNIEKLVEQGEKARPLKLYFSKKLGKIQGTEFMSLTELFNRMFGGVKKGINVMTKMGLSDIILGANKARRQIKEIQDRYAEKFGKSKNFFKIENAYERGVLSFLTRNVIGSDIEIKAEFNRRVDMLMESVEALKNGDAKEQKMAEIYEKLFDKLDVKSRDIENIYSKAEPINAEAVNWWIQEWSQHYDNLSEVSRSVYNTILGKDTSYTPDRYKMTSEGSIESVSKDLVERNSSFLISTDTYTDKNESGVMIASVRPTVLPKGRYVSLDFDMNNVESLTGALVDIETAGAIRQVDAFLGSSDMKKLIPTVEDRTLIKTRINRYIRRTKNKMIAPSSVMRDIDNLFNTAGAIGTSLSLGGLFQAVKQTASVAISTAIQSGRNFNMYTSKEFNNWLNTTGASVVNRGQESLTAIESTNKKLESFNGNLSQALSWIKDKSQWQLKLFLSRPDVFVARAGFKSYYEQFLRNSGYDISKINWSNWNETIKKEGLEELNRDAVIYADTMVSRQQNVSDERLAGEFLATEDSSIKLIRKVALPFASFSINQRGRLINDIISLTSNWKNLSSEDRAIAMKSIAGTLSEQASFQMINFAIGMILYNAAAALSDHEDDDEEWEKRITNATKYPLKSLISDLVSPLPITDDAAVWSIDKSLAMLGSPKESEIKQAIDDQNEMLLLMDKDPMTEKQEKQFREDFIKDNTYQLAYNFTNAEEGKYGMLSIATDQYTKLVNNYEMASNGTFTDEYMGKETTKYLTDKDKSLAKTVFYSLEVPYSTGAGVKEMGQVANKTYSIIKKRALTEDQYEMYKNFKKEYKSEPKEYELKMIKSGKSYENISDEINFINQQGGLNLKQGIEYSKLFEKTGFVTKDQFDKISKGMKYEYVIKTTKKTGIIEPPLVQD